MTREKLWNEIVNQVKESGWWHEIGAGYKLRLKLKGNYIDIMISNCGKLYIGCDNVSYTMYVSSIKEICMNNLVFIDKWGKAAGIFAALDIAI